MQGFPAKYNCNILVYIKYFDNMQSAIAKEKIIKGSSRKRKLALIVTNNPSFGDYCKFMGFTVLCNFHRRT